MFKLNRMDNLIDHVILDTLPKKYNLKNPVDIWFCGEDEIRLIEDKPKVKINQFDLMKKGGAWLGCIKNWIQRKCINGESVTWGSDDFLRFSGEITVRDMEYLAAHISQAAINEYCNKKDI